MKIVYSFHAEKMCIERGIRKEWVMEALASPDAIELNPDDATSNLAFKTIAEYGMRHLRVVFRKTGDDFYIITNFFDRGRKKYEK